MIVQPTKLTTEEMHRMYTEERMSASQIGLLSGLSQSAVHRRFKKSGLFIRSQKDAVSLARQQGRIIQPEKYLDFLARFWSKVDIRSENVCWPWLAGLNSQGYPVFMIGSKRNKTQRRVYASHVAWELANHIQFPEELEALHSCDWPRCCNPAHIRPDTHKANMEDSRIKKRNTFGIRHPCAKLNDVIVTEIRQKTLLTGPEIKSLASQLGVKFATIYDVIKGRTWRHLPL